jgi:hypothetical protein
LLVKEMVAAQPFRRLMLSAAEFGDHGFAALQDDGVNSFEN